jgi:hypothetical protein
MIAPLASASPPASIRKSSRYESLVREIRQISSGEYHSWISRWKQRWGSSIMTLLLEVSQDAEQPEKVRSIALMSATELVKETASPRLHTQAQEALNQSLKSPLWLMRLSAIKGFKQLEPETLADALAQALEDPALVVRAEAARNLCSLANSEQDGNRKWRAPSQQSLKMLAHALHDPRNYSEGKPVWVPQSALCALAGFHAQSELPAISRLLHQGQDPELFRLAALSLKTVKKETPRLPARSSHAPDAPLPSEPQ